MKNKPVISRHLVGTWFIHRVRSEVPRNNPYLHNLLSSCLKSISIRFFTESYFLQLTLPLLSYNSLIQCPYNVRLECQVWCCVIQDAVTINQDAGFINQEVRRQLLINAIFEVDWTRVLRWFRQSRRFRWLRFSVSGFSTCQKKKRKSLEYGKFDRL